MDQYQDKNNTYSLDGLPALLSSRRRHGKSVWMDERKRWLRSVWYGKLDAVFLGWLIGVIIAIFNEIAQRYGATIAKNVTKSVERVLNRGS